ncbi:putative lipoprotein [Luteibacter sp. Sphag1AF]|uniref:YbaY family lipoprotein n=1 Tax=Luteibacter sp. Sphag1AF TaxID=2587031 RepID=UPI001610317F|nr:YbaY family lipoprotein [Luteibacter sp. Sphag1AF]MBB3228017.1 putative lipoprotein [Luteibacter sp. Sphag1AF]
MRRIILSLTSMAALALAGCNHSSDASQQQAAAGGAEAAGPQGNSVSGNITLRDTSRTLSSEAKLDINIVDLTAHSDTPVASKTVQPVTLPLQFKLDVAPGDINPSDMYVVEANLVDGERSYTTSIKAQVLTGAGKNTVDIQLVGVATPGEKELAGHDSVKKMIGGMKVTSGTELKEGASRSWQIFKQGNDTKFIRELVDYGDKGFTSTDYSYKNGKPWVVVQEKKPSKDGKPTSTERAGWNDAGELVLKDNVTGSKTENLPVDAANDLRKQSEAIYAKVGGSKK